jgi:tetraacyldisaccharide 4'-kinase
VTAADHLYAAVARWRRGASPAPRRLRRPVVSVGNLAVGGSGKTPTTAYLYRVLADAGERPAILSRGYARTDAPAGVTVVADGRRLRADLGRAGDEPLLLARGLPGARVLVCEDRYLAGLVAERHLDATVHVLDDGFQHFRLGRDVDLLIVDVADVHRPRTLPGGRLREPLSAAASADALLVTGAESVEVAEAVAARLGVPTGFMLLREVEPPVEETLAGPRPLDPGGRVLVVSGIARPKRFVDESREAGLEVVATLTFRDHHPYTPADIERMARAAADAKADLVLTTEKDCVRLLPLRPWPFRVAVRPMTVRVEPAEAFATWLLARVRERASGGAQDDGVGAGLQSHPPVIS